MRQLGVLASAEQAERLQNFFIASGMPCSIEVSASGAEVWIHHDDQLPLARMEWDRFLQNPEAERYQRAKEAASQVLRERAQQRQQRRRQMIQMSDRWDVSHSGQFPVTVAVLVACGFVFADIFLMGDRQGTSERLLFSTDGTWQAILGGEWWRLLSPSVLHFSPMHILFNMLGWWQLGQLVEQRKGPLKFLGIVLLCALATNVVQFQFGGWRFGGMSGVVLGLVGYLWMKGRYDPHDGLGLPSDVILQALIFFAICWTGALGPVANFGHLGGLLMGMLLGAAPAVGRRL